ncbi:MAG: VWA domain-containing protein [Flavobacteriales bacterium]|jgi:Ca-activated chloride channel family protein|nr:VWA domain-containing protein [Flavobacteriales bacterium]
MRRPEPDIAYWVWCAAGAIAVAASAWIAVSRFTLAHPELLWLGAVLPLAAALQALRDRRSAGLTRLSTLSAHLGRRGSWKALVKAMPLALGIAGMAMLIIALARPQSHDTREDVHQEGIDIVIAMDISGSMLAKDLKPDRLEAAKRTGIRFIDARPNDRIGLVVYEGEAFTQCPLTTDHATLKQLMADARSGLIEGGTAVGMGLATAVNRMRESEAKSKVVVLLTDGVNNTGSVQPIDAAHIAEALGVRVYTIGVGTRGKALSPVARYPNGQYKFEYIDVDLDEPTMKEIAALTGGKYFRATDEKRLREIYEEIDQLERTRIEVEQFTSRKEEFHPFALLGASLLLAGFLIDRSLLRGIA